MGFRREALCLAAGQPGSAAAAASRRARRRLGRHTPGRSPRTMRLRTGRPRSPLREADPTRVARPGGCGAVLRARRPPLGPQCPNAIPSSVECRPGRQGGASGAKQPAWYVRRRPAGSWSRRASTEDSAIRPPACSTQNSSYAPIGTPHVPHNGTDDDPSHHRRTADGPVARHLRENVPDRRSELRNHLSRVCARAKGQRLRSRSTRPLALRTAQRLRCARQTLRHVALWSNNLDGQPDAT